MVKTINLWLDDVRKAPAGWVWVKTAKDFIKYMSSPSYIVLNASLDHDLGPCDRPLCLGVTCKHADTGYTVCCWMEEHDIWPVNKPTVHSANPVGAAKMQMAINKKYDGTVD